MSTQARKLVGRLAVLACALVALWLLSASLVAYRLTRPVNPISTEPIPGISWGKIESLRLKTSDGQSIGAWFIDKRGDGPIVLLLPGNGAARAGCLAEAELAASIGCPVLMISMRAHGDSTGDVNDFGLGGRHDVLVAVHWLEEHHTGRPIVVWGQSLGAAAAIFAAGGLGERVRGYILESPYRDLHTAVLNRTRVYLPPVLAEIAYAGLRVVAPLFLQGADKISPLNAASRVPPSIAVLIFAGSDDGRARPEEGRAIREAIGDRARLVIIEGGDHAQLRQADPGLYRREIREFLRSRRE